MHAKLTVAAFIAALSLCLGGCGGEAEPTPPSPSSTPGTTGTTGATGTPSTPTSSDGATPSALAKAYPLDVCIVSDEKLGSMGKPIVKVHEGQEVKFCCKSCVPRFDKEPAKYMAKLAKAAEQATAPHTDHTGHNH